MTEKSHKLIDWLNIKRKARMPDLGAREILVLETLWSLGTASSQDILERITGKPVTLSTIQSTLERLHRKGLVERTKEGRAYRYRPLLSRSRLIGALLRDLSDEIAGGEVAPMISGFMDYVAGEDSTLDSDLLKYLHSRDDRDE